MLTYLTSLGGLEDRASRISHGDNSGGIDGDVLMRWVACSPRRSRRLWSCLMMSGSTGEYEHVRDSYLLAGWWEGWTQRGAQQVQERQKTADEEDR